MKMGLPDPADVEPYIGDRLRYLGALTHDHSDPAMTKS